MVDINYAGYLAGETSLITGSTAYDLPGYTPQDMDICILCDDQSLSYHRIMQKIQKLATSSGVKFNYMEDYSIAFHWGGRTFGRVVVGTLDFFLVDATTFRAIKKTTIAVTNQPMSVKELLLDKDVRVRFFQLLAEQFMK